MSRKQWTDPRRTRWRCLVEGCDIYNVWQDVPPGSTHVGGEHYDRVHAVPDPNMTPAQRAGSHLAEVQRYALAKRETALAAARAAQAQAQEKRAG